MLHNDRFDTHKVSTQLLVGNQAFTVSFFKASLVILTAMSLMWIGQKLCTPSLFPIRYVKIISNGPRPINTAVRGILEPFIRGKFSYINLQALKSEFKQWPSVERVRLWRIMPGMLIVYLSIRHPVAVSNVTSRLLVNQNYNLWIKKESYLR